MNLKSQMLILNLYHPKNHFSNNFNYIYSKKNTFFLEFNKKISNCFFVAFSRELMVYYYFFNNFGNREKH